MEKQTLIQTLSEAREDQLLLAKLYDRLTGGERKNIPASTCFLTGREQILGKRLVERLKLPNVYDFGGAPEAERRVLCYIPDYYSPEDFLMGQEGPVSALRAEFSEYDTLTHRDFLGSIMGRGLKRDVVGDLFVGKRQCDFLVLREMASYLCSHLLSVGRASVRVSEIALSELIVPPRNTKAIHDTVASLRLDSVMAAGFRIGRSKAREYISAGKTERNHMITAKADREVQEGDLISARGLGKFRVAEVKGMTKKGRISLTLERFL